MNYEEETPRATDEFEDELRSLILSAFADGVTVEDTWEITHPSAVVPTWRVTIRNVSGSERAEYEPEFIDE